MTTVLTNSPLEDLEQGLARLRGDGWGQGSYFNVNTNCYCAVGALSRNDCSVGVPYLAQAIANSGWADDLNFLDFPDSPGEVIKWNDTPGRTWPEVESVYLAAIELAKT